VFLVQHILIPPIILHASYELYNPQFFNQLGSILTMAFVGTTLNTAVVAFGLYYFWQCQDFQGSCYRTPSLRAQT
jgi:NhaP-type Na+/H+ or K+/H+ antiporter